MPELTGPYSKGDTVPTKGDYVCVPCGFKRHYEIGDNFAECISCFSGTAQGQHDEFVEGLEMWEPVQPPPTAA